MRRLKRYSFKLELWLIHQYVTRWNKNNDDSEDRIPSSTYYKTLFEPLSARIFTVFGRWGLLERYSRKHGSRPS